MINTVLKSLLFQSGAVVLIALLSILFAGLGAALAMLYGGGVAVANATLLFWRWRRGVHDFHCDANRHVRAFFRSSLERFFVVVILLAVGFVLLDDNPLALLTGFVVGQAAWMLAGPALSLIERT